MNDTKLTGKVLFAAFLMNQVGDSTAKLLTETIISMTTDEMAALKFYIINGTFVGL